MNSKRQVAVQSPIGARSGGRIVVILAAPMAEQRAERFSRFFLHSLRPIWQADGVAALRRFLWQR